jgi:flagellar basal body rod protein FlgB
MGFGIDMAKAREIHKTNIRIARTPKLQELDVEFQKALETGASTTDIVAKKQALRDAPADAGIASASDADSLKAQWKTDILGTSPYS